MASASFTHSELAAKLIVEGCIGNIAGAVKGKLPIEGVMLNEADRAKLGVRPGGSTIIYTIGETGVYVDFHGSTATVWFTGVDSSDALGVFEKTLKKAYPKAVQREDKAHPTDQYSRQRSYDVPVGGGRVAVVDVGYPAPGAVARGFLARIAAYARKTN